MTWIFPPLLLALLAFGLVLIVLGRNRMLFDVATFLVLSFLLATWLT